MVKIGHIENSETGFTEYNYRTILACAEQFFSNPRNRKGFAAWLKEEKKKRPLSKISG